MFGFFLSELLIAIFLISFVAIPLLQSEIKFSAKAHDLCYRNFAFFLAVEISQRLKANPDKIYQQREIYLWSKAVSEKLPKGKGKVTDHKKLCQIEICWKRRAYECLKLQLPCKTESF